MSLFAIVALALAGLGVYCAYKNPKLGAAILVGIAVLTVVYLIGEEESTSIPTSTPTSSGSVPAAEPPGSSPLSGPVQSTQPETEAPGS